MFIECRTMEPKFVVKDNPILPQTQYINIMDYAKYMPMLTTELVEVITGFRLEEVYLYSFNQDKTMCNITLREHDKPINAKTNGVEGFPECVDIRLENK